jgi:hypothetical protein
MQHPPLPLNDLLGLKAQIASGVPLGPEFEKELRGLIKAHPILSYTWETGHTFWRGRTRANWARYTRLREMLWPPAIYAKPGRSNLAGEPKPKWKRRR